MLQNDLNKKYKRSDTKNMKFNANKFELLWYGKELDMEKNLIWKKTWYGKELDMEKNNDDKEQVWDLAIMMGNTDTFTLHIRNIVKKARDKMGWVLRVFQSRKRSLVLTLLKSLVIPLLESMESASSGIHGK